MPEPITLTLGVAIGKVLLRWADLNDTADAVEDARAGFNALRMLGSRTAADPVSAAITGLLEQRLTGVSDESRRDQMRVAVGNVATLFERLSDDDIRAAAQRPEDFPEYLAHGPGQALLRQTEEALTPFTRELMNAGARVFAELAPRSGRFTSAALVRLLENLETTTSGVSGLHSGLAAARTELLEATDELTERIEALHSAFDRTQERAEEEENDRTPAAVRASRLATSRGAYVGLPIVGWDPAELGVHASITVHEESALTPYVSRPHDQQLREQLARAKAYSGPSLILVIGTSCTGKTRTLYEAVSAILPDWQLAAPCTDRDLARLLLLGIPAQTVVWLDELQNRIPSTPDGVTATRDMLDLLGATGVGPILFAGTIWPTFLASMRARPTPAVAATGAGIIPELLAQATVKEVPECFTSADLTDLNLDLRLRKAFETASRTTDPVGGLKITQVLAGATQLIQRLHPQPGTYQTDEFSPAAKAVLRAAGDLGRIGMRNPIPRWAIEGAAPAYLLPPDLRPPHQWLQQALEETTHAAMLDDHLTGPRALDIHHQGVPALTPRWITNSAGRSVEAYDLHDYLLQDHLTRYGRTPTHEALWTTLASSPDPPDNAQQLADNAANRGLLTPAIELLRPIAATGNRYGQIRIADFLAQRGGPGDLDELRTHADTHNPYAQHRLAGLLAQRGGPEDLTELRTRANAGDWAAHHRTLDLLAKRGDPEDVAELRTCADSGDKYARNRLAHLLADRGDPDSVTELRTRANTADWAAQDRLADMLADRGDPKDVTELRTIAGKDNSYAKSRLAGLLAQSDAGTGTRSPYRNFQSTFTDGLQAEVEHPESLAELRNRVITGTGGSKLLNLYRATCTEGHVQELDCRADPVFSPPEDISPRSPTTGV